eukprot:1722844-Amphidinium_carterae.1
MGSWVHTHQGYDPPLHLTHHRWVPPLHHTHHKGALGAIPLKGIWANAVLSETSVDPLHHTHQIWALGSGYDSRVVKKEDIGGPPWAHHN